MNWRWTGGEVFRPVMVCEETISLDSVHSLPLALSHSLTTIAQAAPVAVPAGLTLLLGMGVGHAVRRNSTGLPSYMWGAVLRIGPIDMSCKLQITCGFYKNVAK
jgi:hypothetical protein